MDSRERRRRRRLGEWCYTRKQKEIMERFIYALRKFDLATIDDSNAMIQKNSGGYSIVSANWTLSGVAGHNSVCGILDVAGIDTMNFKSFKK